MTNLHDITQAIADTFGFEHTDSPEVIKLVEQILTTLLERTVTQSFGYLSVEDQQILDGMLDADASPEDVVAFLSERIPNLSEIVSELVTQIKSEAEQVMQAKPDNNPNETSAVIE